ncbi:MAG: sensor histidine kinase [Vicinamibacterales bacterium]
MAARRGGTLRWALAVGFGLTLGLWAVAGYTLTIRVGSARHQAAVLDARYMQAQESLATVRTQVLLASMVVRDALLDETPGPVEVYRKEIDDAYRSIDLMLARYVPVTGAAVEGDRVQRLRRELQGFRQATRDALAGNGPRWGPRAPELLRSYLPKRENVIAVSEELQAINRAVYVRQQADVAGLQARLQRQVLGILGLSLAVSLLIALLAFRYATGLERGLLEQQRREEEISEDRHRLSTRLLHAQEDERRRVARELHDEVGQLLSAVNLELAAAQQTVQRAAGPGNLLDGARAMADFALRAVRDLSQLLHPSVLDDLGLAAALKSMADRLGRHTGLRVSTIEDRAVERLPPEVERAAYRIAQEAMTNVVRHSRASAVTIRLTADARDLWLTVEDDGVGFDTVVAERPGQRGGLGLLGIRERVAHLGGDVSLDSAPGRGTRLEVRLPLWQEVRHAS